MAKQLKASIVLQLYNRASAGIRAATRDFSAMRAATTSANKAFDAGSKLSMAAQNAENYARRAAAVVAAPITTAANFEYAMSAVHAITGANQEQFDALTAKAKELGATTRYTSVEAAQGMKYLGMAGFKTNQILEALPSTMSMATAGGLDLGRAADIASNIMGGFGIEASQMGRVADVLSATFTSSNSTLEELGEAMKYVAPNARDVNISLEETAAMVGLLHNAGIKGTMAGTSLSTMIARLAAPSGEGRKAIKALGIETMDAQKNMLPLTDLLPKILEKLAGKGSGERKDYMSRIFGFEAAASASNLLRAASADEIKAYIDILRNSTGRANDIAKTMFDNLTGDYTLMTSAIDGLNTAIGDELKPTLRSLVQYLTGAISSATEFAGRHKTLAKYVGLAALAITALLAVGAGTLGMLSIAASGFGVLAIAFGSSKTGARLLGGALKWMGRAALGAVRAVASLVLRLLMIPGRALMPVVSSAAKVATSLYAMAASGWAAVAPFLPIIIAVGLVAAAAYLIYRNWKPIKAFFAELWSSPVDTIKDMVAWIKYLADTVQNYLMKKMEPMFHMFDRLRTMLPSWAGGITEAEAASRGSLPADNSQGYTGARQFKPGMFNQKMHATGEVHIKVDSEGRPRIQKTQSSGFLGLDVDAGMVTP